MSKLTIEKEIKFGVKKLIRYYDQIKRCCSIGESFKDDPTKEWLFRASFFDLDNTYATFNEVAEEVRILCIRTDDSETEQKVSDLLSESDDIYGQAKAIGLSLEHKDSLKASSKDDKVCSTPVNVHLPSIKLPKLNLPQFSGQCLSEWPQFRDLYLSVIHNHPSLSDIEKFHFLLGTLIEPARGVIKTLPITEKNYKVAWDTLYKRYECPRILASFYLDNIIDLKPLPNKPTLTCFQKLLNTISEHTTAFFNMQLEGEAGFILLTLSLRLLDADTRSKFEAEVAERDKIPTLDEFLHFMEKQCKILEASKSNQADPHVQSKPFKSKTALLINDFSRVNQEPCSLCNDRHCLYKCTQFLALSSKERFNIVKSIGCCINCLSISHKLKNCNSKSTCKTCSKPHHTLLHFDTKKVVTNASQIAERETPSTLSTLIGFSGHSKCTLLGTGVVHCLDSSNQPQKIRIVVDTGSHVSFITHSCAKKLGLRGFRSPESIVGLGQTPIASTNIAVTCTLRSRFAPFSQIDTDAVVTQNITSDMPSMTLPEDIRRRFDSLRLADPQFWKPSEVDFLLGNNVFMKLFPSTPLPPIQGDPSAMDTIFGWIIMGEAVQASSSTCTSLLVQPQPALNDIMQQFWVAEDLSSVKVENPEDALAENHFETTHYRDATGRYVVALPFRDPLPILEGFAEAAFVRFRKLESRLKRQPQLRGDYFKFLDEYESLGHMELAKEPASYIIPHHPVIKPESSTTKLRVVFDASFAALNGSLNDYLMTGPKLQLDISDIVLGFRLHNIVFTADISKMYRQILVRPEDRKYQHIFWRKDFDLPVRQYQLNTVTYGLSSAPFLALRVLRQLAIDEGSNFPQAASVLQNSIYIDDIVTGAQCLDDAIQLRDQLVELLSLGGFELRKWTSNTPELLQGIPTSHQETPLLFSTTNEPLIKVLGLQWKPVDDCFCYHISADQSIFTKRAVLSTIARIFDPLGWLAPVVFRAKHFLQKAWLADLDWDQELPSDLLDPWRVFLGDLPCLTSISIPRFMSNSTIGPVHLLGFCDASENGYAAVVYLRVSDGMGPAQMYLLKAKSKLAPMKTISIPRLELCASLLLARLVHSLPLCIKNLNITGTYFWTDSTIVLAWLRTPPHLLKTFVANRVSEIIQHTIVENWFHVPSEHNPADCASRGLYPTDLICHPLWWAGPAFAVSNSENWPLNNFSDLSQTTLPELKVPKVTLLTTDPPYILVKMENVSSFSTLQRIIAYLSRFVNNCRVRHSRRTHGALTVHELKSTTRFICRVFQKFHFRKEFLAIERNGSTNLNKLAPFIDSDGLIRVGGRLRHSDLHFDSKHPILLPQNCHLTTILIDYYHKIYGHAGPQLLQSLLSRNFWIISARKAIRQAIFRCLICYKLKAKTFAPMMGDLPPSRCRQARPFLKVGIDYAGPFSIKEGSRKNAKITKAYLCVFVCMATKAVHLEVVSSLTTDGFLATLDRFIARRGLCSDIFSDCGTNFVGAAREFRELFQSADIIEQNLANREICWHFNPPSAPHFGGLWEATVKSAKYHLTRIAGDRPFSFEELTTVFSRIEAILNSRPLCELSSSPDEYDALTPGHFLIGAPLLASPEHDLSELPVNRLSRWQLLQQFVQHFWRRWLTEYLHTLQQRRKWATDSDPVTLDELVLLRDSNISPLNWRLGRVVELHPGSDNIVRVVTVRFATGTLKRPVAKLVRLPYSK